MGINLAFSYRALDTRGNAVSGSVVAANRNYALYRLRQAGLKAGKLSIDPIGTINQFTGGGAFSMKELARFYQAMGKRLEAGKPLTDGLTLALEYLSDPNLKQAVIFMRQALLDGNREAEAMRIGGFPSNDCMIVRAAAEAGSAGKAFLNLAAEYGRREALASRFKKLLFMPSVMAFLMMVVFYASVAWLGPKTMLFLSRLPLDIELSSTVATFFAAVAGFQKNPDVYTGLYVGGCIGLVVFVRSRYFRWLVLDRVKVAKDLGLKSDLATLWGSFALLYDAGLPVKETCRVLGDAAKREDTREWFRKMGRATDTGRALRDAVTAAGFPPFIVSGIKSALEEDSLSVGIGNMVDNLRTELEYLSEKAAAYVEIGSILLTAVGVAGVFMVTYYPMVSAALSGI